MINKRRSVILALTAVLTMILAAVSVNAESTDVKNNCTYDGSSIESTFSSDDFARIVSDLQPGDDVTFEVTYKNGSSKTTDWYMENAIEQTLEKTTAAKKVSGLGTAEGGGYTYELTHYDSNGKSNVLFSNDKVGGDAKTEKKEGLEPATNAMEDWFYIDTLDSGESGKVVLHVAFDGETEVNDYMDTDGGLNVRFAVEEVEEGNNNPPSPPVKTGDSTNLMTWTAVCTVAALFLLVFFFISRKKDKDEAADKAYEGTHAKRGGKA